MNIRRGVYFLANDKILDLSIAFLNSFRRYNPDVSLCLIPFDCNYKNLKKLSDKYNFYIFEDKEILNACDQISIRFFDKIWGHFRKLAMWEGPFDEFVYIDSDTVVLSNVEFSFKYLSDYDFITSHSNIPSIRHWVWKESIYTVSSLSRDQIDYAANTGYIISHKKALPLTLSQKKVTEALEIKDHMELFCGEQPFLNYLFVTSGKYTSLLTLSINNPDQNIPHEQWGGRKDGVVTKGNIHFPNAINPILLIHWAGIYRLNKIENWCYLKLFQLLGIKKEIPSTSFFMPNKRLWSYYRFMNK